MGSTQHILKLGVGDARLLLVLAILRYHAAEDEVLVVPTRLGLETATHLVEMRDIPGDAGRDVAQVAETVAKVVGAGLGDGAERFPLDGRRIPAGAIPAASRRPLVVCRVLLLRLGGPGEMHAGWARGNWM
ncbi:hypothetical protein PG991_008894 [Apiospora marii]|uniref:Uncharacterized protein n=1 Tax=Apiospora marii TaxID=335849 RepID=A0ABR1RM04_9PEZI